MSPMQANEVEDLKIQLLLEGVYRYYGFDFHNYAMASLKRRTKNAVLAEKLTSISSLQDKILHDRACMERFLLGLSVNVTSMFRDPHFYVAFRNKVVSLLRTFLKQKAIFTVHNSVTDASFNEFNVILCRNVLIYFNSTLQDRVHKLFYESLKTFGILGLGKQESLLGTPYKNYYGTVIDRENLFRRIA